MNALASIGAGRPATGCWFPTCDQAAVTETGMCDAHRRVAVSSTGSWLEAG
jgi:hypothetical protein